MSLNEEDGKMVACSCNNSFVGVWVVDLNKMRPFSGPAIRKAPAASGQCPQAGKARWHIAQEPKHCTDMKRKHFCAYSVVKF